MLIKHRYQAQGPWVDVHFKRSEDPEAETGSHVPARLWFNEDADFKSEPEFFDEVQESGRAPFLPVLLTPKHSHPLAAA